MEARELGSKNELPEEVVDVGTVTMFKKHLDKYMNMKGLEGYRPLAGRSWEVMLRLDRTLLRPLLEYCVQFWLPSYGKDIIKLERFQKRFIRMLLGMEGLHYKVRKKGEPAPIYVTGTEVEKVESIKFLRVTIDATVKKAQQCLFFLRQLRKFGKSVRTLTNFYRCTIESILSGCIMAWYGKCSAQDHKKLQKVVHTAQTITETNLQSMDSIYTTCCCGKVANIIKDA
eukprot:g33334.t1